jgi:hypothetical protein
MLAWIFKTVLSWASSGVLRDVLNSIGIKSGDMKTQVTIAAIDAEIQARFAARDVLLAEQGHFLTRMIRPLFAYPLIIYYAAVIADSLPVFGHTIGSWQIARLPDPMMEWSGWIITAYFLTRPFENLGRGILQTVANTSFWNRVFGGGK